MSMKFHALPKSFVISLNVGAAKSDEARLHDDSLLVAMYDLNDEPSCSLLYCACNAHFLCIPVKNVLDSCSVHFCQQQITWVFIISVFLSCSVSTILFSLCNVFNGDIHGACEEQRAEDATFSGYQLEKAREFSRVHLIFCQAIIIITFSF